MFNSEIQERIKGENLGRYEKDLLGRINEAGFKFQNPDALREFLTRPDIQGIISDDTNKREYLNIARMPDRGLAITEHGIALCTNFCMKPETSLSLITYRGNGAYYKSCDLSFDMTYIPPFEYKGAASMRFNLEGAGHIVWKGGCTTNNQPSRSVLLENTEAKSHLIINLFEDMYLENLRSLKRGWHA